MKRYRRFKFLLIPFYSIACAGEILIDGIVDFCEKVYFCFRRGPIDELSEYVVSISDFIKRNYGKTIHNLRQRFNRHAEPRLRTGDFERPSSVKKSD